MSLEPTIYEMHINPTYSVVIPQRKYRGKRKSMLQKENEINLQSNLHKGVLSKKATQRLSNSVNWLVASAKNKRIYDKETGKKFSFKINFVTLTLPSIEHGCSDNDFKKILLHSFINACRYSFGLKNYVWKVETQSNGNIHAHFTTDVFMHWKELRKIWNRILSKNGYMSGYTKKHINLSFQDYKDLYLKDDQSNIENLIVSFKKGVECGWSNPNSTDVHAVHKVDDISAYLASYMSKKEKDKRPIKGRLWGCSSSLSHDNKLVIELLGFHDDDLLDALSVQGVHSKVIEGWDKVEKTTYRIGDLFFYKISDWGSKIKGRLLAIFREHCFNIRNGIQVVEDVFRFKESIPIFKNIVVNTLQPSKSVNYKLNFK